MIKVLGFLKRRTGMSVADFRHYYENHHRRLGERVLAGYACHYQRRYLESDAPEGDFDVLLEVWYPDAATHQAASAFLSQPEIATEIAADEERLFERPSNRFFIVAREEASELDAGA